MRVAVAFDHRGVRLRERLLEVVAALGHEAVDLGTDKPVPRRSIYDGTDRLGDFEQRGAGIVARDRHGKILGTYDTVGEATAAVVKAAGAP